MKGFIVYADYLLEEDKTLVRLFGRLENNQSFAALFNVNPYFFIEELELGKAKKLLDKFKTEKTDLSTFKGEKVIKISSENHTELNKLSSALHQLKIDTYESDIKPHIRFIIDNNLLGSINLEGDNEPAERLDKVYRNPKVTPLKEDFHPKLKTISIDIETSRAGKLYCIGIYGENYRKNYRKNFIVIGKNPDKKLKDTIQCKSEEDCLEKFKSEIMKLDPDIITGWNFIDFDLQFLQNLFKKHKIQFDLGRTNDNTRLRIESNFFRSSSVDITGRQVLDAMNLLQDPFIQEAPSIKKAEFESYKLEDVAQALLKKGKLITGEDRGDEIESLYETNSLQSLQKLVDYNLMDCQLAYEILEKTDMINLAIERSQLTGLPIDRLNASIAAFDSLYIRESRKHHLVNPTTKYTEKEERIKGGYVFSSHSGIYHNVLIFDFKSLYPSIIKTFNIDPASFLEKNEKDSIEAPNKAHFKNSQGILPDIIAKLHLAREKAKKEKRELSSYAIKIIMNSFFGVLASPNCRYFNLDIANAITHFGQMIIKLTAQEIEKQFKMKVIYSDTDSVFVVTDLNKDKANKIGVEIQEHINNFYKKYTKDNYNRQSFLELEFEKQYLSLMIPQLRMKQNKKDSEEGKEQAAAKKRYAGLLENNGKEELEITGLEAIRGDWTDAAQEFQKELLMKVFHKVEITSFIKSYIKKINEGKMDEKLVYRKSIRKNLDEYTKTTPPHVKAARKLDKLEGNVIEYIITTDGPEPIQKLKHKPDYEHYIEKQIKPIANQVLLLFGKDFDNLFEKGKQTKLF